MTFKAASLTYLRRSREPRDAFVRRLAGKLRLETGAHSIQSFRTPHVVFFLAAGPKHEEQLERNASRMAEVWQGQIDALHHD